MKVGEFCNRETVICRREATIPEVARLMRRHHVGDVVVTEGRAEREVPVGILTDRDIVVGLLAEEVDLAAVTAGDVMSFELATAREEDDLLETVKEMRRRGVRRMPVVKESGALAGLLSVDDLIELLSEELGDLVQLLANERAREEKRRG